MKPIIFTPAQPSVANLVPKLSAHNSAHRQCLSAAREAALWAALAGLELMAHKLTLPHGSWMPWVSANCEFSHSTAGAYIRAAQRAIDTLGEVGLPSGSDEASVVKARLVEMLTSDGLDEARATAIASIGPVRARTVRMPKPKRYRAPRPVGPRGYAMHDLPKMIERLRLSPPEFIQALRAAFLDKAPAALRVA